MVTPQGWRTLVKPGSKVGDKTVDPEFGDFTWLSYREVWDRVQGIGSGLVDRDLFPESGPERVRGLHFHKLCTDFGEMGVGTAGV